MRNEPEIIINGKKMTTGQSMTIRVALNAFLVNLQDEDALGDDYHGRVMAILYKKQISNIIVDMHSQEPK